MHHEKTFLAARGKWRGILCQIGVPDCFLAKKKNGPCPFCGGRDRYMFDDKDGSGSFICRQCGAGFGLDFVMRFAGLSYGDAAARVDAILGNVKPDSGSRDRGEMTDEQRRNMCLAVWRATLRVEPDDLVSRYLSTRGISECPDNIRLHPKLRDGDGGTHPCMVAKVSGADGTGETLHRTFLRPDGYGKAEIATPRKLMAGSLPDGSCVRLGPVDAELGIAEGIETALSAAVLFGLPVWAALTAGNMVKWLPPDGVESVTVFGDADKSHTGQAAAHELARRVIAHAAKVGREIDVTVKFPPALGLDWNDVLLSEQGRKSA